MKKFMATIVLVSVFIAGSAIAADKQRDRDQDRTKGQLKDGSCQEMTIPADNLIANQNGKKSGDQDGTPDIPDQLRDRLRDDSCGVLINATDIVIARQNGKRSGDQDGSGPKRDGSCLNSINAADIFIAKQNGKRSGDQDGSGPKRLRDGSCLDS